jgi:hypothetical protein
MRLLILFCLVCGPVATLWGESTEVSSEADLARSYYSAFQKKDKTSAEEFLIELKKRFPDDTLTQLVVDHWQQQSETLESLSWEQFSEARRRKNPRGKEAQREQAPLIAMTYNVADLIVPIGPQDQTNPKLLKNVETLEKLIQDSCLQNQSQERVAFYEANLAFVVRGTEKSHQACQKLLSQLRVQHDVQLTYEITLASVAPDIANSFSLRESISSAVYKERQKLIDESEKSSLLMAPKITLFNDQIASIEMSGLSSNTKMELHGQTKKPLQAIRTEFKLSFANQLGKEEFKFATSDTIANGRTAAYFVKTEDSDNSFFDRRLLIEKGMQVEPSDSNQLFLFITPKILIVEEEEELIGLNNKPLPRYAPVGYPHYGNQLTVPSTWTPVKLNWDDDAWNFSWPSPAIRQVKHEENLSPNQPTPRMRPNRLREE